RKRLRSWCSPRSGRDRTMPPPRPTRRARGAPAAISVAVRKEFDLRLPSSDAWRKNGASMPRLPFPNVLAAALPALLLAACGEAAPAPEVPLTPEAVAAVAEEPGVDR